MFVVIFTYIGNILGTFFLLSAFDCLDVPTWATWGMLICSMLCFLFAHGRWSEEVEARKRQADKLNKLDAEMMNVRNILELHDSVITKHEADLDKLHK